MCADEGGVVLSGPSIWTLDIETLPLEVLAWGIRDQVISLDQIKTDWSILSFAAKKLGSKEIIYKDTMGRGARKVRDDSQLLKALWQLLDRADIIVAQNGKRFDLRKIRARLLIAGYKPFSPIRVIDTYKEADKLADFTSHKLAYLSEKLAKTKKSEHKRFPGLDLWKACLQDDPRARVELRKYNKLDVIATEEVYLVLAPWMEKHPNLTVYVDAKDPRCPTCSSKRLQCRGPAVTQSSRYQRYHCQNCGAWPRGKEQQISKDARKKLLVCAA